MAAVQTHDGKTAKQHSRVLLNLTLVWLDKLSIDFDEFKRNFSEKTSTSLQAWFFCKTTDECCQFITQADQHAHIVLISSGRLGAKILPEFHNTPKLHSIYIYCNKKDKYESWKENFGKIRGIFDNSVQLFDQMCHNLDEEARQLTPTTVCCKRKGPPSTNPYTKIHCLFQNSIKSYYHSNIPWESDGSAMSLPEPGQATIEIWQSESIPFELHLTTRFDKTNSDNFTIVLKVNENEAQISILNNQSFNVRDRTTAPHEILQKTDSFWHCYWFTFYGKHGIIQYGIGEVQPKFSIFQIHIVEAERNLLEQISQLELKIDCNTVEPRENVLNILIGNEPVIFDPPLFIASPDDFSPTKPVNSACIPVALLNNPCGYLYKEAVNFVLQDDDFPQFIQQIERSVSDPCGWCYQKLEEKKLLFGRSKSKTTYICLKVDKLENGVMTLPCLIKIWPPGHRSPIHNNNNDAYGVIRVLYGKLTIKFFPSMMTFMRPDLPVEQLFEENQVTWMSPKLNRTCQFVNPQTDRPCCITIHYYKYETNDDLSDEQFDFFLNDEHHIKHYRSTCDSDYLNFKHIMKDEFDRNNKH